MAVDLEVSQIRDTFLGFLIRIIVFLGLYSGPIILGNYSFGFTVELWFY